MGRSRKSMKVTTVRFGSDLWAFLQHEAALAGVSVSQYLREAALARASAAAGARGEDPLQLLSGSGNAGPLAAPEQARPETSPAERAIEAATRRRDEAEALTAQSRQAVRHASEIAARRARGRSQPTD